MVRADAGKRDEQEARARTAMNEPRSMLVWRAMRIWVVDDQREVREGVAELIQRRVVAACITGQFARGGDALKALQEGRIFEVALVDLGRPDMQGEEAMRHLRLGRPHGAIVAFTVRCDEECGVLGVEGRGEWPSRRPRGSSQDGPEHFAQRRGRATQQARKRWIYR